jgi:diacylglycerol kinase (ATP)
VDILDLSAADARSAMEQGQGRDRRPAPSIRIVVAGGDGMVHLGANLCAGTRCVARHHRGRHRQRHRP